MAINAELMTKKEGVIRGEWKNAKNQIDLMISMIVFEEDDVHIAYCPALDLSGYGKSENEALESFNIVMGEYFTYTTNKKTLAVDLKKHGWLVKNSKTKPMRPPDLSTLLSTNKDFNRIFNNFSFKKVDQRVSIPAC